MWPEFHGDSPDSQLMPLTASARRASHDRRPPSFRPHADQLRCTVCGATAAVPATARGTARGRYGLEHVQRSSTCEDHRRGTKVVRVPVSVWREEDLDKFVEPDRVQRASRLRARARCTRGSQHEERISFGEEPLPAYSRENLSRSTECIPLRGRLQRANMTVARPVAVDLEVRAEPSPARCSSTCEGEKESLIRPSLSERCSCNGGSSCLG